MNLTKLILYGVYNILVVVLFVQIISFLNTYVNTLFIPKSFRWNENGVLREDLTLFGITQFLIANIEALVLVVGMYFINKVYLGNFVNIRENGEAIAFWTGVLLYLTLYIFVFRHFYYIYR